MPDSSEDDSETSKISISSSGSSSGKKSSKHKDPKTGGQGMANFMAQVQPGEDYKKAFDEDHKMDVILDTGCLVPALFCNPDLVHDIRKTQEPLYMTTSTGVIMVDQKATVPGIGEVWFDPDGPTNLLSYSHMEDRFKITRDNKAHTFQLHTKESPSSSR